MLFTSHRPARWTSTSARDSPRAETNWVYTASEGEWFAVFRCHAPSNALYDKRWYLPDIEARGVGED
jgi:hypothetical protein